MVEPIENLKYLREAVLERTIRHYAKLAYAAEERAYHLEAQVLELERIVAEMRGARLPGQEEAPCPA
jgi:hypothetical protein